MKFYFRRALASIVLTPLVAVIYVLGCALLIGAGAGASFTAYEAFANGLIFGGLISLAFIFFPQVNKLLDKLG